MKSEATHHRTRLQGVRARWSKREQRVGGQREQDREAAGGDELGPEDVRLAERVEDRGCRGRS